jgi:predicted O-methyltransferase YrrM
MLEAHLQAIERGGISGVVVECGVAAGGSAALMGSWLTHHAPGRRLVLFDTFAGLPSPTVDDPDYDKAVEWTGACRGTVDEVTELFQRHGIDMTRVTFVEGLFQDTIPAKAPDQIAVAHLDGDWYASTKHCLEHLWPRISVGGRVQLDDYGFWQGCRKATDEFLARTRNVRTAQIDQQGLWLEKLSA